MIYKNRAQRWTLFTLLLFAAVGLVAIRLAPSQARERWVGEFSNSYRAPATIERSVGERCKSVLAKANELADSKISYDPAYVSMKYPYGDVPSGTGVCSDVIIRSFRSVGIDFQKEVHESMKENKKEYPNLWGLKSTDKNIDHRRVPNLMVYLKKHANVLPISTKSEDYAPCDIVTWDLGGGLTHIGLVSNSTHKSGRPLIIHHIGGYPAKEDMIFRYKVIGHFAVNLD